jgi:hypothetical protein
MSTTTLASASTRFSPSLDHNHDYKFSLGRQRDSSGGLVRNHKHFFQQSWIWHSRNCGSHRPRREHPDTAH